VCELRITALPYFFMTIFGNDITIFDNGAGKARIEIVIFDK
jgi:hypothetical protein